MSVCGHCKKTASFLCGNCKVQLYCSKKCQTYDWATHQATCIGPRFAQDLFETLIANLKEKVHEKDVFIQKFLPLEPIVEVSGTQNGPYFEIRFRKGPFPTFGDFLPPNTKLPGQTWDEIIEYILIGSLHDDTAQRDFEVWDQSMSLLNTIISNLDTNYHPAMMSFLMGNDLGMQPPHLIGVRFVPGNFDNFLLRLEDPMEVANSYQRFTENVKNHINYISANVSHDRWVWSPFDYLEIEDEKERRRMYNASKADADKATQKRQK